MHRPRGRHGQRRRGHAPGTAPGTVVIDPAASPSRVRVMAYGPDGCDERLGDDLEVLPGLLARWPVVWVNVDGLGDEATLGRLAAIFGLHKLALEDVVNLGQRPKLEPYGDYVFLVTRPVQDGEETEQLSLFLGRRFVLTLQEKPGDDFDRVRSRLRLGGGLIRRAGPDYLCYALLDAAVDGYFPALERVGEALERLEDEVLGRPRAATVGEIHGWRRTLIHLRRALAPHRDVLVALQRDAGELVSAETAVYLRDVYDHAIRATELADTLRELAADLMSTYLSRESNRLNEVMKVLTVIATIFIPLSFIAGVYGMNFDPRSSPWNLPELEWYWGYPFSLALMGATALGLVGYFWRKGWFR